MPQNPSNVLFMTPPLQLSPWRIKNVYIYLPLFNHYAVTQSVERAEDAAIREYRGWLYKQYLSYCMTLLQYLQSDDIKLQVRIAITFLSFHVLYRQAKSIKPYQLRQVLCLRTIMSLVEADHIAQDLPVAVAGTDLFFHLIQSLVCSQRGIDAEVHCFKVCKFKVEMGSERGKNYF